MQLSDKNWLYEAIEKAHETVMNFTPRQLKAAWDSGLLDRRSRAAWEARNGPLPPPPYDD